MPESKARAILEVQVTGVNQGNNAVKGFQENVTRSMTASEKSVASAIGGMIAQYASLAVAVRKATQVMSSGVEFNKFVENQTMSFGVMMKSMSAAKEQMKSLYDFAVNSPLTFKETAGSAKQLMAYGFAAKELVPTMETLGTVAVATGNRLDDIAYVYGTLRSQGRAYSRDLMQFGMRGIPIYEELARVMGVGTDQIQKMASEGKIGFKEIEKAFKNMTDESGRFGGTLDAYMDTLTGKMSMLGDIAEQSAGKLMNGVNEALKTGVEDFTKILGSNYFSGFIEDMSSGIGNIASLLGKVLAGLTLLLPIVAKLVTLWIAFGAVQLWFKLPSLLMKASAGIAAMSAGTLTATSASVGLGYAWDKVLLSISASGTAIMSLMAPIALVVVAIGGISNALREAQRTAKMIKDEEYFNQEIIKQARGGTTGGMGVQLKGLSSQMQLDWIDAMTKKYKKTSEELAKILYFDGQINATTAMTAGFNVDAWVASVKLEQSVQRTADAMGDRKFISTLEAVGLNVGQWDSYVKSTREELLKMGKTVPQGIAELAEPGLQWKTSEILKTLPSMDVVNEMIKAGANKTSIDAAAEDVLKSKVEVLKEDLVRLIQRDLANPTDQNTQLKEWLAKQLNDAQKELDGFSKKNSAWLTFTPKYNIQKETEARMLYGVSRTYQKESSVYRGDGNTTDQMVTLAQSLGYAIKGAIVDTRDQMLQGSEMGAITAGKGVSIAGMGSSAAGAMVSFLQSIENVSKVLNPFATMLEAMRSIIEPLINSALQPLVNILEMVGEAVGEILRPIIGITNIITAVLYPMLSILVGIIQMVGSAFTWFYDAVIVPVANKVIDIVNSIIKLLNKIPGVHIRYLKALEKSTSALEDYAEAAENAKASLSDTISYLEDKLSDMIDSQIASYQDLYEVGAISATEYADAVKKINAQSINKDTALVSLADRQLDTQAEILARLADLYNLQNILNTESLTDEEIADLLKDAGLTTESIESVLIKQIDRILAAMGQSVALTENPAGSDAYQAVVSALEDSTTGLAAVKQMSELVTQLNMDDIKKLATYLGMSSEEMASYTEEQLRAITELSARMRESGWTMGAMGGAGLSVGASSIPYDGFPATLHKNEGVIPATFMDGIRSGELSLSGGNRDTSSGSVNVYVTVQGSVTAEEDLATTIAEQMYVQRKRNLLTV